MKIYILRHEDKTQDATFFSPLTSIGLGNAEKLVSKIEKLNIDVVYSSPYLRTLQTIAPFIKKTNKTIKLEYGLSEINHPDLIPKNSFQVRLPEYIAKTFNYENNYKEIIPVEELSYPEDDDMVMKRIKKVLHNIISKYSNTEKSVLLVTHQCVCRNLLKIVEKNGVLKPSERLLNKYPKGGLTLVFDDKYWVCKEIN
jgi:2,3-bisphosphoglycerate-dependent phosphoglycerate mutase